MKLIVFSFALLFSLFSFANDRLKTDNIDSVLQKLRTEKNTLKKIELNLIASEFFSQTPSSYVKCYEHLNNVKSLLSKVDNPSKRAKYLLEIGTCFMYLSDNPLAISNLNSALLIVNGLDTKDKVLCYNRLGNLYSDSKEYQNAIYNYKKGILLVDQLPLPNSKNFETLYNNLAVTLMDINLLDSAMYYHKICLKSRLKTKDILNIGQSYNNIGSVLFLQGEFDSSLYYFKKGLSFRLKSKKAPETGISESEINIAKALIALNRFAEAEILLTKNYKKSLGHLYSSIGFRAVEQLMILYSKNKQYQKAMFFTEKYYTLKDSMYSLGSREEVIRQNLAFQYNEKVQKDSIISIQKKKSELIQKQKEREIQSQKDRESKIVLGSMILLILLMSGIIFLVVRSYRIKKKVSEVMFLQKNKLEKTHQEITDSITYAKRIQSAILPQEKVIKEYFEDSFILYKPKDIVAGDFYWFEVVDNLIFLAAADCTGHGVPGAMVSVVCNNALNRSIKEFNLKKPSDILDKTREIVVSEFEKSDEEVKDGMDISLCAISSDYKKVYWAGANNPLWILRNGEVLEFKADKQPIGNFAYSKPFTNHEIELQKGDEIFLTTDGYQDQFGGEMGKKLKSNRLKDILKSMHDSKMEDKKSEINSFFQEWKGDLEQIDDVCIIGIRL